MISCNLRIWSRMAIPSESNEKAPSTLQPPQWRFTERTQVYKNLPLGSPKTGCSIHQYLWLQISVFHYPFLLVSWCSFPLLFPGNLQRDPKTTESKVVGFRLTFSVDWFCAECWWCITPAFFTLLVHLPCEC